MHRKRVGSRQEGGRERERERDRERVRCKVWVEKFAVWVINLTIGQVYIRAKRQDNPEVYQDEHQAYPKNLWTVSVDSLTFHLSDKLTIYHPVYDKQSFSYLPKPVHQ